MVVFARMSYSRGVFPATADSRHRGRFVPSRLLLPVDVWHVNIAFYGTFHCPQDAFAEGLRRRRKRPEHVGLLRT